MWSIIKEQTGKSDKGNRHPGFTLTVGGKPTSRPEEVVDIFASHFTGIPAGPVFVGPNRVTTDIPLNNSSIFLNPVSENEMRNIILSIKSKSSQGLDGIPSSIIRQCVDSLIAPLCHLVNESFVRGEFPSELKSALIRPLFKKGNVNDVNNYRPISILNGFSKVYEKAMSSRILSFFNKHGILSKFQHGFRKDRSVNTALFEFVQNIYSKLDKKLLPISIFCDLTKAFDTVNHKILLHKLYKYGIRGNAYEWIRSYLSNREQLVEIETCHQNIIHKHRSQISKIEKGVPQGSVIGPLFFLVYINDLPSSLNKSESTLFADDTNVTVSANNIESTIALAQSNLQALENWTNVNELVLNPSKSSFINFSKSGPFDLTYNHNTAINKTNSTKFLGVIINQNLNWSDHIEAICTKIVPYCYGIFKLNSILDVSSLKTIYYGYIYPHLKYGIICWGNTSKISSLFTIQKRAIRCIARIDRSVSCKPFFQSFRILTIISIYILECALFVKKNSLIFKTNGGHSYETRSRNNLEVVAHNTSKFEHSPYYSCVKIFERLPQYIKQSNEKKFKSNLIEFLNERCFYKLNDFLNYT
jgi:hypothetical protein